MESAYAHVSDDAVVYVNEAHSFCTISSELLGSFLRRSYKFLPSSGFAVTDEAALTRAVLRSISEI